MSVLYPEGPTPLRPLAQDGLDAGEVATHRPHLGGGLELPHRLLDAQPEQLIVQVLLLRPQLVEAQLAYLTSLHHAFSWPNRAANFVLIGSFAEASCMARRASVSLTPSISNITRPGRTTHT